MTEKSYREFDFREIAELDDAAMAVRDWVAKSASFFNDFWRDLSEFGVQLSIPQMSTQTYKESMRNVPRSYYSCNLSLADGLVAQWWASTPHLKAIVWEMLGIPSPEVPEETETEAKDESAGTEGEASEEEQGAEKEADEKSEEFAEDGTPLPGLSPVELSLAQLLFENIASALTTGWMGADIVEVKVGQIERDPQKSRLFRSKDLVARTALHLEASSASTIIHWISPKQGLADLLETVQDARRTESGEPKKPDPSLVGQAQFELVSVLGRAKLPMLEVSRLQVGQTIALDQRIDQPIKVGLDEKLSYNCWPGRRGNTQALEIESAAGR